MIESDQLPFLATFTKLRKVYNIRGDSGEISQVADAYFRALRPFSLHQVTLAAETWLVRGEHFPKPAQWIAAIPRRQMEVLPAMTEPEVTEHRRAKDLYYEDEPCDCHECQTAGVTHRMLRYVPDTDADDQDVRMLLDGKVVIRGHWAHGHELARWYSARDAFMGSFATHRGKLMPKVSQEAIEAEER